MKIGEGRRCSNGIREGGRGVGREKKEMLGGVCSGIHRQHAVMHVNHERPLNIRSSCPSNDRGIGKGETGRTGTRPPVET